MQPCEVELFPGTTIQPGTLLYVRVHGKAEKITLLGHTLTPQITGASSDALFGVPYEAPVGQTLLSVACHNEVKVLLTVEPGLYTSEVLHVDGRRVHPQKKEDLDRIRQEQKAISALYSHIDTERQFQSPFLWPIASLITSSFGTKRLYNGSLRNYHTGCDLRAPEGTSIHAPAKGRVRMAQNLFFTGNTVFLDHGLGLITLYAHMSRIDVRVDQVVEKGAQLGLSGKTGRVSGPHLHWQAVIHGVKVNPVDLVRLTL